MDVNFLWKNEKQLKSLTGLEKHEAEILFSDFSDLLQAKEDRKKLLGGRPNKLPMLDFFLMMMFYVRHHPTYSALGALFGLATSNAERRIQEFLGLLHEILKARGLIPLDTENDDIELLKAALLNHESILIDGTEQPIRRPKEKVPQKDNYSGKKKRHTSKILLISDEKNIALAVTPVYVGSSHDFAMFKYEKLESLLPHETPVYIDTGFEGADKIAPQVNFRKPKKKPRKRQLNGGEKLGNSLISKFRVKVEHVIGAAKKFKMVSDICRSISEPMGQRFKIAFGLSNFHLERRALTQI